MKMPAGAKATTGIVQSERLGYSQTQARRPLLHRMPGGHAGRTKAGGAT
jgi:hypothetical protein